MVSEELLIKCNYPDAIELVDYELENTGQGVTSISKWNEKKLGPKPDLYSLPEPSPTAQNHLAEENARRELSRKDLKAVVLWIASKLNVPPAQARDEIIAIRKGL